MSWFRTYLLPTLRRRIVMLAWLALAGIAIGQLGQWYWLFDLFSHFVPYYAAVLVGGCLAARALWLRAIFGICAAIALFWAITPWPMPDARCPSV